MKNKEKEIRKNYVLTTYNNQGEEMEKVIYYNDPRPAIDIVQNFTGGDVYYIKGLDFYDVYQCDPDRDEEYIDTVKIQTSEVKDFDVYDIYDRYTLGDYIDEDGVIHDMGEDVSEMVSAYVYDELLAEIQGNHCYKHDSTFMNDLSYFMAFID